MRGVCHAPPRVLARLYLADLSSRDPCFSIQKRPNPPLSAMYTQPYMRSLEVEGEEQEEFWRRGGGGRSESMRRAWRGWDSKKVGEGEGREARVKEKELSTRGGVRGVGGGEVGRDEEEVEEGVRGSDMT